MRRNSGCLCRLNKAFSHNILLDKVIKYGLNGLALRWAENWLNSWSERIVTSSTKLSCRAVTSGVPQGLRHT